MKIQANPQNLGTLDPREPSANHTDKAKSSESIHGDRVEISLKNDLSIISERDISSVENQPLVISSGRLDQIRQRIQSGFYDSEVATSETADRLLDFYQRPA